MTSNAIKKQVPMQPFNSLKSFERLTKSGVDEAQARVFISIFEDVTVNSIQHLTTKEDLKLSETLLRQEIIQVETSLRKEITQVETSLHQEISRVETSLRQEIIQVEASLRQDLLKSEAGLKQNMAELRTELKADIARLEGKFDTMSRVIYGMFAVLIANMVISLLLHH